MKIPELIEGLKKIIDTSDDTFVECDIIKAALEIIKKRAPLLQPHILLLELYEARKECKNAHLSQRCPVDKYRRPVDKYVDTSRTCGRDCHCESQEAKLKAANRAGAALRACLSYAKKFKGEK
jgi:hypothetical protein